jgi:hypothetical protein
MWLSRKHMEKHTRPLKCTIEACGQSFGRSSDRLRHEAAVHKHQSRYLCSVHGCKYSQRGFARKDHLKQHSRTHSKVAMTAVEDNQVTVLSDRVSAIDNLGVPKLSKIQKGQTSRRQSDEEQQMATPDADPDIENWKEMMQELKRENLNLRNEKLELRNENKRLRDQIEKQTDTIHSLVTRGG